MVLEGDAEDGQRGALQEAQGEPRAQGQHRLPPGPPGRVPLGGSRAPPSVSASGNAPRLTNRMCPSIRIREISAQTWPWLGSEDVSLHLRMFKGEMLIRKKSI